MKVKMKTRKFSKIKTPTLYVGSKKNRLTLVISGETDMAKLSLKLMDVLEKCKAGIKVDMLKVEMYKR